MENANLKQGFKGEFRDIITYADGTVEVTDWSRNTIVNDVTKAIAYALAQKGGATFWAVGKGLETWDNVNPPSPNATDNVLTSEIGRKAISASNIVFLNDSGSVSSTPTNVIQITVTFGANECNGSWREFAIVGGNATASANTGILINHKTHALIQKDSNMQIERQMRFTFN